MFFAQLSTFAANSVSIFRKVGDANCFSHFILVRRFISNLCFMKAQKDAWIGMIGILGYQLGYWLTCLFTILFLLPLMFTLRAKKL